MDKKEKADKSVIDQFVNFDSLDDADEPGSKTDDDRLLRALADAENARKRADRAKAEGREAGVAAAVAALAPVYDMLLLGLAAAAPATEDQKELLKSHIEGLERTLAEFDRALDCLGVEVLHPQDERFDPKHHEAVAADHAPDREPGDVISVLQTGFRSGDRLIRPARVVVAREPETPPKGASPGAAG